MHAFPSKAETSVLMKEKENEWYVNWFNSSYYHLLYSHRDEEEAKLFINSLQSYFSFGHGERALDIPCGKGRHAISLSQKGLNVTGADLASENIRFAKGFSNKNLNFIQYDMRFPVSNAEYDYVLNLFTSFGYFDSEEENIKVIRAFNQALRKDGILVIDFLNADQVIKGLVEEEKKEIKGIKFYITRKFSEGKIQKHILVRDGVKEYHFMESVQAFGLDDFKRFFEKTGFDLFKVSGDYNLHDYNDHSNRLILFAKKIKEA